MLELYAPISPFSCCTCVQVVSSLTKYIVETYTRCNPDFRYSEALNPKRYLTTPSAALLNNGHDNANSDLVLYVNLELVNVKQNRRFAIGSKYLLL